MGLSGQRPLTVVLRETEPTTDIVIVIVLHVKLGLLQCVGQHIVPSQQQL